MEILNSTQEGEYALPRMAEKTLLNPTIGAVAFQRQVIEEPHSKKRGMRSL